MAARAKPLQEFIPNNPEEAAQIEYGRRMALAEATTPETTIEPEEADPDDIALQNVLSELGSSGVDAKVNIYQLDARQNRAFIGAFLPSEFSLERVQSEFGPGEYEIRVYRAGKLATRKVIKIAAPKNSAVPGIAPQNNGAELGKIVETMNAGFNQLGTMFAQALQGLAQNQPKPKSTLETLQEFQLMKEVFGGNSQPAPDPMAMVTMALELSEKIRPREGEPGAGEIIMEAVKNFAPTINSMVASAQQNSAHVMSAPPVPQIPAIPQIPAPENDEMNIMQKVYVKTLIAAAASNAAPETYANNILDLMPEQTVLDFVGPENWFTAVVEKIPEAAPHADWFGQLKQSIIDLTRDDEGDSVASTQSVAAPTNAT